MVDDGSCEYSTQLSDILIGDSAFVIASDEIDGTEILNLETGLYNLVGDGDGSLLHFGIIGGHTADPEDQLWITFTEDNGNLTYVLRNGNNEVYDWAALDEGFWNTIHGGFYYVIIRKPESASWVQDYFMVSELDWGDYIPDGD